MALGMHSTMVNSATEYNPNKLKITYGPIDEVDHEIISTRRVMRYRLHSNLKVKNRIILAFN
jgi:hypothetical protein